ncbi:hypothetical protein NW755_014465 [Fusarium falciforme]|uniref:P68 RBP/TagC-like beta-propeller domain-containing protein n=1 Tax=Fusarium falciforme TaxID=195108 RepID=A0A9W8QRU5_9HYPO|nr:hypothetical protein NW755_014465 [Fusarium falciforme]
MICPRNLVVALATTFISLPFTPAHSATIPENPSDITNGLVSTHRGSTLDTLTERAVTPAYFNLKAPSHDLFRHKSLHDETVQQSFAFDQKNRRLFVAQRRNGTPIKKGDLCITQLDFSGKYLGHMYLNGFGHGVAFGAQAVGKDTYLWTEVDSKSNGYGERLARFKFVNGKTLSNKSSALTKFKPIPKSTAMICVINPVDNTLVVRYTLSGAKRIAVYDLMSATKGDFSKPVVDFKIPTWKGRSSVFQGYTAYGQYMYVLTGTAYDVNGGVVDSEVTSINLKTGKVHQGPIWTKAGQSLSFREPEGMGVYTTAAGEPRLFLGFASGKAGDRRCNIFYKSELVQK